MLERGRAYLAAVRNLQVTIPDEVSNEVTRVWVGARASNAAARAACEANGTLPPPRVGEEELHRWLSLAKLASMSFGEGSLTRERFAWAKELDDARLARG